MVHKGEDVAMEPEGNTVDVANVNVHHLQILGGEVYWLPFRDIWVFIEVLPSGWWGTTDR